MSNSLVRYAVAAAMTAAAASAAHATSLSSYAANQQAGLNVNVYISGSTAVDNTIASELQTASLNICQNGTVTTYTDSNKVLDGSGNVIGGAKEYIYYCQAGVSSGVATTKFLAVFKESTAGSIHGAQPLIQVAKGQSSGLTFLNPTGPDVLAGTCAGGGDTGCTTADFQQNVVPTGGVADVEANLLRTVPGGGTLSTNDINTYLAGAPGLDVVWGVAVTKNLFYALQVAEHLTDGTVAGCTTANNDSPACAPSLSKEQVASLLLGANNSNGANLLTWNQIAGLNNATDNNVYVCRRDVGSGTEASFEAYFLGARCSSSSEAMATQDGQFVIESASGGNVLKCLQAFDQGGISITPYNQDFNTNYPPFTPPGGQWAIGILSTELKSTDLSGHGDAIRLVAVDGVLPTLANVVNGYYPYFSTDAWYTIKTGNGVPTGDPLAAFKAIQGDIGHPIPTQAADATYANRPWGSGGDLAPASLFATSNNAGYATFPVTTAAVEANPINLFSKASSGTVDNCDTPVLSGNVNTGLTQTTSPEGVLIGSKYVNQ
jgi:hypothetical protein